MLLGKSILLRVGWRPSRPVWRAASGAPVATSVAHLVETGLNLFAQGKAAAAFGDLQAAVDAVREAYIPTQTTKEDYHPLKAKGGGYKGVHVNNKKWSAYVTIKKKRKCVNLSSYDTPEAAGVAFARVRAACRLGLRKSKCFLTISRNNCLNY